MMTGATITIKNAFAKFLLVRLWKVLGEGSVLRIILSNLMTYFK